jgi:hypothetical protein
MKADDDPWPMIWSATALCALLLFLVFLFGAQAVRP